MKLNRQNAPYRNTSFVARCLTCKEVAAMACFRCGGGLCGDHRHDDDTRCARCEADFAHRRPLETLYLSFKSSLAKVLPGWLVAPLAVLVVAIITFAPAIAMSAHRAWVSWYGTAGTPVATDWGIALAIMTPLVLNYVGARFINIALGKTRARFLRERAAPRRRVSTEMVAAL